MQSLVRFVGRRLVHGQVGKHTDGGVLDARFGFALLKDRRVPLGSKAVALGAGAVLTAGMVALELPLEGAIALLMPVVGLLGDAAIDGVQAVAGPLLIASLLLPRLAPAAIVQAIREERALS